MRLTRDSHYDELTWARLRTHRGYFAGAALATMLIVAANLVEPQLVKFVIDLLVSGSYSRQWVGLFALWGGVFLVQHMALFLRITCIRRIESKSASDIRRLLFHQFLNIAGNPDQRPDDADLAIGLTRDVEDIAPLWGRFPLAVLWYVITIAGALGFALLISVSLTVYLLCAILIVTLLAHWADTRMAQISATAREALGNVAAVAKRSLQQLKLIQLYLAENQVMHQLGRHTDRVESLNLKLGRWLWLNQTIGDALGFITLVGVLGIGGYMVSHQQLSLGSLVSFILYVDMLGSAFVKLRTQMEEFTRARVAAKRLAPLLAPASAYAGGPSETLPPQKIRALQIENVSHAHGVDPPLFSKLHHEFRPGSLHIICGKNGTGKSTLLDILSGYTRPTKGRVLLDGQTLESIGTRQFWERSSVLLQEDLIYDDTVAFNLRLGNPAVGTDRLAGVLLTTGLADSGAEAVAMLRRPATALSTGQKRRLAIARAILRDSDVYFFDEPTANLDPETCDTVVIVLQELALSSIVIVTTQHLALFDARCEVRRLDFGGLTRAINATLDEVAMESDRPRG